MEDVSARDFGRLEQQVLVLSKQVETLSGAVEHLTSVLEQSKGGYRVMIGLAGIAAAASGVVTWFVSHIKVSF